MTDQMQQYRKEYSEIGIDLADMAADPFVQFGQWFDEAAQSGMQEPNGMTLSTVDANGRPSGRVVLLKAWDSRGFVFYTNYESRKGQAMAANPFAALSFWWVQQERQVRIEGAIEPATEEESDAYFNSRPRGSRLGAWASPQSSQLDSRDVLQSKLDQVEARFPADAPLPRPEFWGGYRVVPCLLYTSPSPRDKRQSRMPSSA